jgi:hypothetical protein
MLDEALGSARRFECPQCHEAQVSVTGFTDDAKTELRCWLCDHEWVHGGEARRVPVGKTRLLTRDQAKTQFPAADAVDPRVMDRVSTLKAEFLREWPQKEPGVDEFWARYQRLFSAEGLAAAPPKELKFFANSSTGASPGNMSVFNRAWNEMGDEPAATHLRAAIEYLLRGPEDIPVEDRMTRLIDPQDPLGMTGFRESLLTKVLCVMQPERFLPILVYTSPAGGKREIARSVFALDLPAVDATSWTRGRLAFWSNDLLLQLVGPDLIDTQHLAHFLWWAKDRAPLVGGAARP